jgi:hypothetical protein
MIWLICFGIGQFFSSAGSEGKDNRLPAGQFSADLRTLAGALSYLFEPDGDATRQGATAPTHENELVMQTISKPSATFGNSSNQMETLQPFTNRPACS